MTSGEVQIFIHVRDVMYSNVETQDQCKWFNAIWFILLKQNSIKFNSAIYIIYINSMIFCLVRKTAHSVRTDPSSSSPTCPFLLVLVYVVSALNEHWLLISLAPGEAGPSLTPLPQADPVSFRSQATARSHIGYNTKEWNAKLSLSSTSIPKSLSTLLSHHVIYFVV